jgi:gliding motility-associated-like protein
VQLKTLASSDVVSYSWSPNTYLGCADCAMPFCAPKSNIVYTITAKNKYNCAVNANITINIVCSQSVFFPNAFSPLGTNPLFYPMGKGIRIIKDFRIFNRYGDLIFERDNVQVNDAAAAWDGRYNGKILESGTYVYTAEAQCDTGEIIPLKGTVVLIR